MIQFVIVLVNEYIKAMIVYGKGSEIVWFYIQVSFVNHFLVEHGIALDVKVSVGAVNRFREGMSPAESIPALHHDSNFPRELHF